MWFIVSVSMAVHFGRTVVQNNADYVKITQAAYPAVGITFRKSLRTADQPCDVPATSRSQEFLGNRKARRHFAGDLAVILFLGLR